MPLGKYKKPQSSNNFKQIFMCGIISLICFIFKIYLFAFLLLLMTAMNVYLYLKNIKKEQEYEEMFEKLKNGKSLNDRDRELKANLLKMSRQRDYQNQPKDKRKEDYDNFLNQVEQELGGFEDDYEEYDDD